MMDNNNNNNNNDNNNNNNNDNNNNNNNENDNHEIDALGQNFAAALNRLSDVLGESAKFTGGTYNGKNENFDTFVSKFEAFCLANQKNEAYKRTHFPMYLEGRAYDLYDSLPAAVKANWDQTVDRLKQFFSQTPLPPVQAFQRLHQLKMEPNETVQLFYERILKYTKGLNVTDDHKLALFMANLPKYIKDFLTLQNVADLPTALRTAKQREIVGSDEETNEETMKLLASILTKLDKDETEIECNMLSVSACVYCGKEGHAMMDCPFYNKHNNNIKGTPPATQNNQRSDNYQYQRNRTNSANGSPRCYYCSKPGNIMKNCYSYLRTLTVAISGAPQQNGEERCTSSNESD